MNERHATNDPGSPAPAGDKAQLPHDRDEQPSAVVENAQHRHNRRSMQQAHRDTESPVHDTERIGTPNDVPSSADNESGKA